MTPEDLDRAVYNSIRRFGGGNPRQAIVDDLLNEPAFIRGVPDWDKAVSASLQRLQKRGFVFSHDNGGTLSIWKPGGRKCRYWSTRAQLQRLYGYTERDFGGPEK